MTPQPPASPPCSAHEVDPGYMWAAPASGGQGTGSRVSLKRAYAAPSRDDGTRVLVERLWPRGLSKEKAAIDRWLKDLAPSAGLRKWYGHKPERWPEFRSRYREELRTRKDAGAALAALAELARKGRVTLVFAATDVARSSAAVLRDVLDGRP